MSTGKLAPLIKEFYPEYYSWNDYPLDKCIPIRGVKEQWGILGNFAPTPLIVKGVLFSNSEQLFQMMKFSDKETLLSIYQSKGLPLKWAAKKGEKNGLRRKDWGQIIIDVMKFCLQTKYEQSEEFRHVLNETIGFSIVEDQTKLKTTKSGNLKDADTWGVVRKGELFVGSNLLGRLLMELRDNGKLEYHLPNDIFKFISFIRVN
ncbi:MAG: NADAR family protein [Muribaculaceae bacterium]